MQCRHIPWQRIQGNESWRGRHWSVSAWPRRFDACPSQSWTKRYKPFAQGPELVDFLGIRQMTPLIVCRSDLALRRGPKAVYGFWTMMGAGQKSGACRKADAERKWYVPPECEPRKQLRCPGSARLKEIEKIAGGPAWSR
jgi:hypothetical protein